MEISKCNTFIFPLHARKFSNCNELGWTPTREKLVPPEKYITNENMEEFFVQC